MLTKELFEAAEDPVIAAVKKAIEEILVRHARLESFSVHPVSIYVEVEFEFPEHLARSTEIKKAGKPAVSKVNIEKSELWREGVFGAGIELEFVNDLNPQQVQELKKYLEAEKKRTN